MQPRCRPTSFPRRWRICLDRRLRHYPGQRALTESDLLKRMYPIAPPVQLLRRKSQSSYCLVRLAAPVRWSQSPTAQCRALRLSRTCWTMSRPSPCPDRRSRSSRHQLSLKTSSIVSRRGTRVEISCTLTNSTFRLSTSKRTDPRRLQVEYGGQSQMRARWADRRRRRGERREQQRDGVL